MTTQHDPAGTRPQAFQGLDQAAAQARAVVEEWKAEQVYPFPEPPGTSIEQIERQVFDIVAVHVARHLPGFDAIQRRSKAFQLRMLRQAIQTSPESLQLILDEVLRLPKPQRDELAHLLRDTSLSSIVGATRVVSERLRFIAGLEVLLFDPEPKRRLKERTQLHRIVAENCWLFGEEYSLSVDDQSLTAVLAEHRKWLGRDLVIDAPVKHVSRTRGIVDLMLSKATRSHRANGLSHLIVELKAPRVKIGSEEITQIQAYAFSVMRDPRFSMVKVNWNFWVIGDELAPYAEALAQDDTGLIYAKANVTIQVKTWAQILDENRSRLQFLLDKFDLQVDRAASLAYLRDRYADYLEGVFEVREPLAPWGGAPASSGESDAPSHNPARGARHVDT
ncbi:histidine kinase [Burkholderia gladioli]|uniref:histidine kinase n=1 Tax=Burkholderia gladioli TaxID=28095 RepID=UPI0016401CC7|nr:histidine kinase [Burkholderia gladioli]